MTQHSRADTEKEIFQSLQLLGGWATIKELAHKAGYTVEWTRTVLAGLKDVGEIQSSNTSPILYSLPGTPVVKRETLEATPIGITKLAKIVAHERGRNYSPIIRYVARRGGSTNLGSKHMQALLQAAGYKLMLVPIEREDS